MCTGTHPFIPAVQTAQVALRCLYDGQQVENVFHVRGAATLTDGDLTAIGGIVADWWEEELRPLQTPNVALVEVMVKDVSVEAGAEIIITDHAGDVGGNTSEPMPNEVSFALKLATALGGHSGRGRWFFFGLGRNQVDGNYIVAESATALATALYDLVTLLATGGYDFVIASYCSANVWRTTAITTNVTAVSYTDRIVDSQRRRGPGRGR